MSVASTRNGITRRAVASVFVTLLASPACTLVAAGPSRVAQGKYYSSGHPEYDAFFLELYQLQVDIARSPAQLKAIKNTLAVELELGSGLSHETLSERIRARAAQLANAGVRCLLKVEAAAAPPGLKSATLRQAGDGTDESRHFKRAIEAAANESFGMAADLDHVAVATDRLSVRVVELQAQLDSASREGPFDADDVRHNLDDAGKVLVLVRGRAKELVDECDRFTQMLATASNTDDGSLSAPPPPLEPPEARTPKRPGKRRRSSPPPKRAAPKQRPKPQKDNLDFEP